MKRLTSLAVFAGFLAVACVVAAEGKIEPPSAGELRETRALVDEVFPISTHVLDLNRKYKYVAFTKEGGLNVRPKSGNAPYYVKSIKGYLCEWDY